jgi:hypothetical protein
METWIRINTRLIGITIEGPTKAFDVIGLVGSYGIGIQYIGDEGWRLKFSSITGDEVLSDIVEHSDGTDWLHVSSVMSEAEEVILGVNGRQVGFGQLDSSKSVDITNLLTTDIGPQIRPFIGAIHYGPMWFQAVDIELLFVFPSRYLSRGSTPQFQLWNPQIIDRDLSGPASRFYGLIPPGGIPQRFPATMVEIPAVKFSVPKSFRIDCGNFCFHDSSICVNQCNIGTIFNPDSCACEPLPTTVTPVAISSIRPPDGTLTVTSTIAKISQTNPTPIIETDNYIWILYFAIGTLVVLTFSTILWRKRRTQKIVAAPSRRGSEILPLWAPIEMSRTNNFFTDTTLLN